VKRESRTFNPNVRTIKKKIKALFQRYQEKITLIIQGGWNIRISFRDLFFPDGAS